ncbi:MAG: PLP-dependent transferase, partial [Rhodoglobus sp.]|nr:PLP-dependent transferase [Rhodoglobus sp.]
GVARFEDGLSALEGSEGSVAFATGMAALSACLIASVVAGKPHIVALRPLYGGTDHVLETGLLGTTVTWVAPDEVAGAIRPDTGLVILESPANPTLELLDIRQIAADAAGVPVLVDNTFATPVLQRPIELGATLSLHSATKYLGGHGDAMGGIVATNLDWTTRLRQVRALTGGLLHPFAAYMLHRGLRTLPVRVRAQQETAGELARRLGAHPAVARVLYPGLPGQDPAGLVGTQSSGAGALIALELVGGYAAAAKFTASCELITHAVSLGGIDTLVQHPASLTHRPVAAHAKPGAGIVRLSIGLEHVEDLFADLTAALDAAMLVEVAARELDTHSA